MNRKIRVLVVDDSAIVRKILTDVLSSQADIEVVGTAPDPFVARDKILALDPDVLTLDIEMPRMDGLSFLKRVMKYRPMPVIVISSLAQSGCAKAIEAMECGAVDVLPKPGGPYSVGDLQLVLAEKVRSAAQARLRVGLQSKTAEAGTHIRTALKTNGAQRALIAIGASTGGTEAIRAILEQLPEQIPPVVIVQHIPPIFSRAFADRLDRTCRIRVKEATDGDELTAGLALIAPGDIHMLVRKRGEQFRVELKQGPRVCYQRPSVDVLFQSVADAAGSSAAGVLLTGMGADGAQGLLRMKQAGAFTMAQDEATSVVYGMPREAARLGAADLILPLPEIAAAICRAVEEPAAGKAAC